MDWNKSGYCASTQCVEVAEITPEREPELFQTLLQEHPKLEGLQVAHLMRDSRHPEGPVLAFTPEEWEAFTLGVKDGEFDLPEGSGAEGSGAEADAEEAEEAEDSRGESV